MFSRNAGNHYSLRNGTEERSSYKFACIISKVRRRSSHKYPYKGNPILFTGHQVRKFLFNCRTNRTTSHSYIFQFKMIRKQEIVVPLHVFRDLTPHRGRVVSTSSRLNQDIFSHNLVWQWTGTRNSNDISETQFSCYLTKIMILFPKIPKQIIS